MQNSSDLMVPLVRMLERLAITKNDSDTAYFYDLLYLGELALKLATVGMLATVKETAENHRYRLEHQLVRANGVGMWAQVIEDVLVGPASQHLSADARFLHTSLTKKWSENDQGWAYNSSLSLSRVLSALNIDTDGVPRKLAARHWINWFPALRNSTRAHGAPTGAQCSQVCEILDQSIRDFLKFPLFSQVWVYLHRNLSGKYRVVPLGKTSDELDYLKRGEESSALDGLYLWLDGLLPIHLVSTDVMFSDFYVANGDFKDRDYEALSYVTGEKRRLDGRAYLRPPGTLPGSQTDARPLLEPVGETFTDMPSPPEGYIARREIEEELHSVLRDSERFPLVTLVGRGGIGKTSTALTVLHEISQEPTYFSILWFSSRDIDLLAEGPRVVQPQVLTVDEISNQFVKKMNPGRASEKGFSAKKYLTELVADRSGEAPLLLVLDNFETVRNPTEVFAWLSNSVRLPNKVFITTRFRDFKADYPVEVRGMTELQFQKLVDSTATRLGLSDILSQEDKRVLFEETAGHPYVTKVLLGEIAINPERRNVKRILAAKDDILDALFERTFKMLNPAEQRVFLTLCNWRSHVPRLALEAALLRPVNERIDVGAAIDTLTRSSLVDLSSSVDEQEWLHVPLAAYLFGRRKLMVSHIQTAVEADTQVLHVFGAVKEASLGQGVEPAIDRLVSHVRQEVQGGGEVARFVDILEFVARKYPRTWLKIANLSSKVGSCGGLPTPVAAIQRYLEVVPEDISAWKKLAQACRYAEDWLGEMHSHLRLSVQDDIGYAEISHAANRFNSLLYERSLDLDSDEKRVMAEKLRELMDSRLEEANADDCSRLAWLCLHLGDTAAAHKYTSKGLSLNPNNHHCMKLDERLSA